MIGKLRGIIDSISDDHLILDVNGVGYMVYAPHTVLSAMSTGDIATLFIETYVREDNISLFGFHSQQDREAFIILQTVSGIGTRVALAILSSLSIAEIGYAVTYADKDVFRKVSGVGPKLAERILVELKGKTFGESIAVPNVKQEHSIQNDAISALMNLGVNRNEVRNIVNSIAQENPGITLDQMIKLALQKRAK